MDDGRKGAEKKKEEFRGDLMNAFPPVLNVS